MGDFEAIVIGGGHAGIEAALALARLGTNCLLITQNPDTIGRMSCNPAIGGLAKGNLVREIDALGGQMGILTDASAIQLRMLNQSRGAAVQAPRAQADKFLYAELARKSLESQAGLSILMDTVVDIIPSRDGSRVEAVLTERGATIGTKLVVLTTGTFMEARLFIGDWRGSGGRLGEPAALGLGTALRTRGFPVGRMKTGTPARIASSSIDFSKLEIQHGESKPIFFSFIEEDHHRPNLPCHVLWTNENTHELIKGGLDRSPLFSGQIVGKGPRYCPSIEDKVVRFPDRDRHQVFVEPEGEYTNEVYLNGLSSSLPEDVQLAFYRSLPGFEKAKIVRPAYAVEYDYLEAAALYASLESKIMSGLFVAGQTNGTSGYEEAAAQGIMAGINARRSLDEEEPIILGRDEAYIGVLIDDLVTLSPKEPYRMFTSRAERRLALRQDSADLRLTPLAIALGLATQERIEKFEARKRGIEEITQLLSARRVFAADIQRFDCLAPHLGESMKMALRDPKLGALMDGAPSAAAFLTQLLPELSVNKTAQSAAGAPYPPASAEAPDTYPESWVQTALLESRYKGYLEKEARLATRLDRSDRLRIPSDFDYGAVPGLSKEAIEKLEIVRPLTLGQASRVTGVRKSDLALIYVMLSRQ